MLTRVDSVYNSSPSWTCVRGRWVGLRCTISVSQNPIFFASSSCGVDLSPTGLYTHEIYFWIDNHRIISIGYLVFAHISCFTWNAENPGRDQAHSESRRTME